MFNILQKCCRARFPAGNGLTKNHFLSCYAAAMPIKSVHSCLFSQKRKRVLCATVELRLELLWNCMATSDAWPPRGQKSVCMKIDTVVNPFSSPGKTLTSLHQVWMPNIEVLVAAHVLSCGNANGDPLLLSGSQCAYLVSIVGDSAPCWAALDQHKHDNGTVTQEQSCKVPSHMQTRHFIAYFERLLL